MNTIAESMTKENISIINSKISKNEVLDLIAEKSSAQSGADKEKILKALQEREAVSSTGFERGIAIPHCQIEEVSQFNTGLIIIPAGVDFKAMDSKKSYLFFYIVGPQGEKHQHIKILSSASRLLSSKGLPDKIKKCNDVAEVQHLLLQTALKSDVPIVEQEKMLFQISVGNERLFDEILQVAVSQDIESITVMEGHSASNYLYHMPLFASFWSDKAETQRKVIIATVDKKLSNNLIRQIYLIPGIDKLVNEFQINVVNLYFSSGNLGL